MAVVEYRLHPAIGFARVGNSPTEFFALKDKRPAGAGAWQIILESKQAVPDTETRSSTLPRLHGAPFEVIVNSYSTVSLSAHIQQSGFDPGARVTLEVAMLDGGVRALPATATVAVERPDGQTLQLTLTEETKLPFRYRSEFETTLPGVYRCRVKAVSQSRRGHRYTRERVLTAVVWHGGDEAVRHPPTASDDQCAGSARCVCALTHAIAGSRFDSPELARELARHGCDCKPKPSAVGLSRALERAHLAPGGRPPRVGQDFSAWLSDLLNKV